jgi:hypothetical protein
MRTPAPQRARRASALRTAMLRRREQGNVMLVVLLILMMATSTATFVMSSTAEDQRAAGAMRAALRTRYVAETAAMTTLVLAEETPSGLPMTVGTWQDWAQDRAHSPNRTRYGLPSWGQRDPLIGVDPHSYLTQSSKFTPMCTDQNALNDPRSAPDGSDQPNGGMYALVPRFDATGPRLASAPARLVPRFSSLIEVWPITRSARPSFRYVITGIGELVDPGVTPTLGVRSPQDVVTMSRAYYDVR